MRTDLLFYIFFLSFICSCKFSEPQTTENTHSTIQNNKIKNPPNASLLPSNHDSYIYTSDQYNDPDILIENSFPKGGSFLDTNGNSYGYGIFFSTIKNDSEIPLHIKLDFPSTPISMNNPKGTQIEIFLPSETWQINNLDSLDYGVKDLSFFDNPQTGNRSLKRTIDPNNKTNFFVAISFINYASGPVRTSMTLEDDSLIYEVKYTALNESVRIPCGILQMEQ